MIAVDLIRARQYHEAGSYADAARCYDALLALRPDDPAQIAKRRRCRSRTWTSELASRRSRMVASSR
jgi:hypothetical protein